jgi:hypothetical protein
LGVTRIQRDNVIYLCLALGSVIFLVWIIPAYSPPYPGYGASASLAPNVSVGIALAVSVLALVGNALAYFLGKALSPGESAYPEEGRSNGFSQLGRMDPWHLIRFMIPCALFVPVMEWAGFIPAAIAFMLVIQYLCGRREPLPALIVTLGAVSLVYVAMRYGFGVPLPGS